MNNVSLHEAIERNREERIRFIIREELREAISEIKSQPQKEEYYNKKDACEVLGYGRTKGSSLLDKWEKENKIFPVGEGRAKRYRLSELLKLGKK